VRRRVRPSAGGAKSRPIAAVIRAGHLAEGGEGRDALAEREGWLGDPTAQTYTAAIDGAPVAAMVGGADRWAARRAGPAPTRRQARGDTCEAAPGR